MRICLSNLLLFISLYMLYPVIPSVMAERLGMPVYQTGAVFILFTLGMFFVGPFHGYLVDAYKRKYVCLFSFGVMLAATVGYVFVHDATQLLMLCIAQGIAFGIATTAGITLAIDITNSSFRSDGNMVFAWAARLGMIAGVASGVFLYQVYGFRMLIYASLAIGLLGIFFVSRVYVPFRAPIGTKLISNDRFLLLRGWVPAVNLILIALVPGILLPLLSHSFNMIGLWDISIPFFAVAGIGFLVSAFIARLLFRGERKTWLQVVSGLILIIIAMGQIIVPETGNMAAAAVLLGIGLGFVTPEFLMMFVKLSQHCQRGTANTTHLLAWEAGIALGIATVCYLETTASQEAAYQVGMLSVVVALAFFVLITYPYFKKKRVR